MFHLLLLFPRTCTFYHVKSCQFIESSKSHLLHKERKSHMLKHVFIGLVESNVLGAVSFFSLEHMSWICLGMLCTTHSSLNQVEQILLLLKSTLFVLNKLHNILVKFSLFFCHFFTEMLANELMNVKFTYR